MLTNRIDENSTEKAINDIFELSEGSIFSISDEFVDTFRAYIPKDRYFVFDPILKGTVEYEKYGNGYYKVIFNKKTVCID